MPSETDVALKAISRMDGFGRKSLGGGSYLTFFANKVHNFSTIASKNVIFVSSLIAQPQTGEPGGNLIVDPS